MSVATHPGGFTLALLMAPAGIAFGLAYFSLLRRSADLFGAGRSGFVALALTIGRIGAAALVFFFTARLGAPPLLALFAGFLGAREIAIRPARRLP